MGAVLGLCSAAQVIFGGNVSEYCVVSKASGPLFTFFVYSQPAEIEKF